MDQNVIEKIVAQLTEAGLLNLGHFALKGCTSEEIAQLEAKYHVKLPAVYREFLARMGKEAGDFLRGSDYFFSALLEMRAGLEGLLEGSGFTLDDDDFVFFGHQGYQYCFFKATDAPDPAVFCYLEDEDGEPRQAFEHFSEWLQAVAADAIEQAANNRALQAGMQRSRT